MTKKIIYLITTPATESFNIWIIFVAFTGAIVLLALIRLLNRPRHIFN